MKIINFNISIIIKWLHLLYENNILNFSENEFDL